MERHGKIHKNRGLGYSVPDIHRQQHGQGTNIGHSQDILDGGRETAKEGSEKCMSVMWRPQFIQ